MENKKKKKLLVLAVSSASLLVAIGTLTFQPAITNLFGDTVVSEMGVVINGTNGAATETSLKSKFVNAKTNYGNDVKMVLKNCEVVAGKVAKIKAKGWYGNEEPINGGSKIVVSSNAVAGDAIVKYGLTSACLDGSFDLAAGNADGLVFNYFKIVAKNDVVINSIGVELTCDNSNNGFVAQYGDTDNRAKYKFTKNTVGGYDFQAVSASSTHYVNKLVVPDYYTGSDGYLPVNRVMNTSSYGLFEKAIGVQEVYFPETVQEFGTYTWSGSDGHNLIKSITYPRDLAKASSTGNLVPFSTSLETIYYNCKNLVWTGNTSDYTAGINGNKQPNLKYVYVSYDVEKLCDNFMNSDSAKIPAGLTVYYEGTEAEWAALTATATNWANSKITAICSDSQVFTTSFMYENSTLGGDPIGQKDVVNLAGATVTDPGEPVWTGEGDKVFVGWYTQKVGGEKVTFPFTVEGNSVLYAHFDDRPAGYTLDNPKAVALGDYEVKTSAVLGSAMYFKYTATENQAVIFKLTDDASVSSKSPQFKLYTGAGVEVDLGSSSCSAEEAVKAVSHFTSRSSSSPATIKVKMAAGESYIVACSVKDFAAEAYGLATLSVIDAATVYGDPSSPKAYTMGTNATAVDLPGTFPVWNSVVPTETGTYTIYFNNAGDKFCSNSFGKIVDGSWVEIAKSNYSEVNAFVELTAGEQYYLVQNGNGTAGTYGFKVAIGTPDGYSAANPITFPLDGTVVQNKNQGFMWNYYKFTVAEAGWYKFNSDEKLFSYESQSYTSTSSNQCIQISKSSDITNTLKGVRYLDEALSSYNICFELEADTYYMKATVYSSARKLSATKIDSVEGKTALTAKAITLTSGTAIDTSDAGTEGKLYEFTAAQTGFYQFTAATTATVKYGKKYITSGNNVYSYDNTATMSGGEMHPKLTEGTTYLLFVKGTDSVGFEFVETIEDGKSKETAYTYVMGTTEKTTSSGGRVGSTCTYFKFVATQTCDIEVTRGSTYSYYFKLYKGDSSVTASSTSSYKQVYPVVSGESYRIEAYSYGFTIIELGEGYSRSNAISKTVAGTDASLTLNNVYATTWYKFTSDYAGFFGLSTTASNVNLKVFINSSTSAAATITGSEDVFKTAVDDVVYLSLEATVGTDIVFAISHPASVQNGKSFETAFEYANDAGQEYMTMEGKTILANTDGTYCYIKFICEANTTYVFYTLSTSGDFDTPTSSGTCTNFAYDETLTGITAYSDWDVGATDKDPDFSEFNIKDKTGSTNTSDCYGRFNSGENSVIYVRYKLKNYSHKLVIKKAADFFA